ncbi:hypothetical protein ACHMW6_10385 [Pseudoduganella sp. UC29_106]|uniref:hypothetical protein n=1 Tax=Pseudoduganella sp. UC29_106 TaxID=3374553 RepID=UPI0037581110
MVAMGPKILWVLLPLLLYGVLLVLAWRGRAPSRLSVNMHGSLLLVVYLLCTAGLGIFWGREPAVAGVRLALPVWVCDAAAR